jgi:RHS repeat-associated protein
MEGVVNNTPVTNAPNQYAYNGGSRWSNELNNMANYLTTPFREYDPVLGRFNGVDIMATKYANLSPYNYGFNNPVYWNDPTGADGEGPTAQEIADIIAKLLNDSAGSGEWSRDAWDAGAWGSSPAGGGCRGCTFNSAMYVIDRGGGSYDIITQVYFGHAGANSQGYVFEAKWAVKTFTKYDINRALNTPKWTSIFDVDEQPGAKEAKISAFKSFTQGALAIFDLATYGAKLDLKDAATYSSTFKNLKVGLPIISIGISVTQFFSDITPQNLVRLQASVVTTAIGFIPVVGPFASFGISIADANGAFDGYYNKFDTWGEAFVHIVSPVVGNLYAK